MTDIYIMDGMSWPYKPHVIYVSRLLDSIGSLNRELLAENKKPHGYYRKFDKQSKKRNLKL